MKKLFFELDQKKQGELRRALDDGGADGAIPLDAMCQGVACQALVTFSSWDVEMGPEDGSGGLTSLGYEAGAIARVWVEAMGAGHAVEGQSRLAVDAGEAGFERAARWLLDDAMEAAGSQLVQTPEMRAAIEARRLGEAAGDASRAKRAPRSL